RMVWWRRKVNIDMLRCHLPDIQIVILSHTNTCNVKPRLNPDTTKHEVLNDGPPQFAIHLVNLHPWSRIDGGYHAHLFLLLFRRITHTAALGVHMSRQVEEGSWKVGTLRDVD